MIDRTILSLIASVILAAVHVFAGKLRFCEMFPRSRWLSFAGGVSIAYTLVHLLPELARGREEIAEAMAGFPAERGPYLIALVGLIVFYGLEHLAANSRRENPQEDETSPEVFWIHAGSFALYNAVIGYTLVSRDRSIRELAVFTIVLSLHFLVNDYALRQHYREQYQRVGRWLIASTVFAGWAIGVATSIPGWATASIIGFLAGGILLNTIKEELPKERECRLWAFAIGAAACTVLLMYT